MKKTILIFLAVLFFLPAFAQDSTTVKPIKIAYFSLDSLLDIMPEMKTASDQAAVFYKDLESKMYAMQTQYNTKQSELENSKDLSPEKKAALESEIAALGTRLEAFRTQSQIDFANYRAELVEPILAKIRAAANAVAAEKGYDIVLDSSMGTGVIVYANPRDDIFRAVCAKLGIPGYSKRW